MSDKRRIDYEEALAGDFAVLNTTPQHNEGAVSVEKETKKPLNRNGSPVINQEKKQPDNSYEETKSRRFQMMIQPTLFEEIRSEAKRQKTSINDLILTIVKDHIHDK